jgi:predicted  nucleic acid-binding Zn-ribbon protein
VLDEISKLEARSAEIQQLYASPAFYNEATGKPESEQLSKLREEETQIATRITALTTEWEQLEQELTELSQLDL